MHLAVGVLIGALVCSSAALVGAATSGTHTLIGHDAKGRAIFRLSYPNYSSIIVSKSVDQLATLTLVSSFEPHTNLADSKVTVGAGTDATTLAKCLLKPDGTVTINGVQFATYKYSDAGAGNFYDVATYRTVHNKTCYAITSSIHWSNLDNFAPDAQVRPFDRVKVQDVFIEIVQSFRFI